MCGFKSKIMSMSNREFYSYCFLGFAATSFLVYKGGEFAASEYTDSQKYLKVEKDEERETWRRRLEFAKKIIPKSFGGGSKE